MIVISEELFMYVIMFTCLLFIFMTFFKFIKWWIG